MDTFTRLVLALVWITVCCVVWASVVGIALMLAAPAVVLALVAVGGTVGAGVMGAAGFKVLRG